MTAAIGEIPASRVQEVVEATVRVSPQYRRIAVNYREQRAGHRERAVAQLILRDTLKVTGTGKMSKPVVGIFYVNPADPDRGGTGHTMRVCRDHKVPVVTQFEWMGWPFTSP